MKKIVTGFSLPIEMLQWLKRRATSENRSTSGMLQVILRQAMEAENA